MIENYPLPHIKKEKKRKLSSPKMEWNKIRPDTIQHPPSIIIITIFWRIWLLSSPRHQPHVCLHYPSTHNVFLTITATLEAKSFLFPGSITFISEKGFRQVIELNLIKKEKKNVSSEDHPHILVCNTRRFLRSQKPQISTSAWWWCFFCNNNCSYKPPNLGFFKIFHFQGWPISPFCFNFGFEN